MVDIPDAEPLVLFDGQCNLCTGAVQWIIRRDPRARLRFATRDSALGRAVLARAGFTTIPETMVFAHRGVVRVKSSAALAIARWLTFPWPLSSVWLVVPRPLRDIVYDWIARNRYRWFGKRDVCWLPTPALRARFLDSAEHGPGERGPA